MRCTIEPTWNHSSIEILPPTLAHHFLLPSSALFTLHPVLHCTRDAPCSVKMDVADQCRFLRLVEGVSLSSHCVVSVDTSATLLPTRVDYEGTIASSFLVSIGGGFFSCPS